MNRPTRTLAALTGAAALTVAGMSPASAALWAGEDAVGDVVSYTFTYNVKNDTETNSGPNAEPDNTDTDITSFTASHKARRLVLRASLRDITADSGGLYYQIRTGTRRPFWVVQRLGTSRASRDAWQAFSLYRGDGEDVRCTGVRRSVDRTTEQAMVSIPRRCLGRPAWVRVGVGAERYQWTETRTQYTSTTFLDDGLSDSPVTGRLTLSPRIQRG